MDAETRKKIESLGKACGEAHLSRAFVAGAEAMEAISKEREAKLVAAAQLADCECSILERMSGHKTGCWKPEFDQVLTEYHAAKGEE